MWRHRSDETWKRTTNNTIGDSTLIKGPSTGLKLLMIKEPSARFRPFGARRQRRLFFADPIPRSHEAGKLGSAQRGGAVHEEGRTRVRVFGATSRRVGLLEILVGGQIHGDQIAVIAVETQHRPNGEEADEEFQASSGRFLHRRADAQFARERH